MTGEDGGDLRQRWLLLFFKIHFNGPSCRPSWGLACCSTEFHFLNSSQKLGEVRKAKVDSRRCLFLPRGAVFGASSLVQVLHRVSFFFFLRVCVSVLTHSSHHPCPISLSSVSRSIRNPRDRSSRVLPLSSPILNLQSSTCSAVKRLRKKKIKGECIRRDDEPHKNIYIYKQTDEGKMFRKWRRDRTGGEEGRKVREEGRG